MNHFRLSETILRSRQEFFLEIRENEKIPEKITSMLVSSLGFLSLYGIVLGANHSANQALSTMVKLPLLFLVTLVITAPSLHVFYILAGARQSMSQTIALLLTAITTSSLILFSLAPITLFILITSHEYDFYKLVNVTFFAFSGYLGVVFLSRGLHFVTAGSGSSFGASRRRLIFTIWAMVYGFVGAQMAWTLGPFIGIPGRPFVLFSNQDGNFFYDVLITISRVIFY
ncbi:MAG: hypothetical protein OEZ02_06990 [Anaerolineae bacterium]|nr:hypothetical protein [Anaerolineae bacterium]